MGLFLGCGGKSTVEPMPLPEAPASPLPQYVFESQAMAAADSLFWNFERDEAEAAFDKIELASLSNHEQAICKNRRAYFAARNRKIELADSLLQISTIDTLDQFWNLRAGSLLAHGMLSEKKGIGSAWLSYHQAALADVKQQANLDSMWLAEVYFRLGRAYLWGLDDAFEARKWFDLREAILYQYPGMEREKNSVHYNLAISNRKLGDYESALRHAIKGKELLQESTAGYQRLKMLASMEIANNYRQLYDTVQFVKYYDQAVSIIKANSSLRAFKFRILDNYGRSCLSMQLADKGENIFADLKKAIAPKDTFEQIRLLEFESYLAEIKGQKEEALSAVMTALELHKSYSDFDAEQQSYLLTNLGSIYQKFGDHVKAIENFAASLEYVLGKPFDYLQVPKVQDRNNYLLHGGYGYEFAPIAKSLYLAETPVSNSHSNLELAQGYYQFLLNLFDEIGKDRGEGVVLRDLSEFQEIFGEAIDCSLKYGARINQDQVAHVFNFMERGKAVLLYQSIYHRSLAEQLGIPSELYEALQEKNEEKIRLVEELKFSSSQSQSEIENELTNIDKEIAALKKKIDGHNPKFFQQLSPSEFYELKDVQEWAKEKNKAILQYHWSTSGLFGLAVWPNGEVKVKKIGEVTSIEKQIKELVGIINSPPDTVPASSVAFKYSAQDLGSLLLDELLPDVSLSDNLVVIPDGIMSDLPFEVLACGDLTSSTTFYNFNYLVRDYNISYHYSSSTLLHASDQPKSKNNQIGLFAFSDNLSATKSRNLYPELPGSSDEVDGIQSVLSGKTEIFKGKTATRKNFEQRASYFDIMHLAMHAEASSDDRFANRIVFRTPQDTVMEFLYAHELIGLNLDADLVFLSACNTGQGVRKAGEGIYSMSRGFISAGVPAIVMSQWELEDQAAPEIILPFYERLRAGKDLDKALRLAKMKYVESKDETRSHPYYWAAIIAIGKTDAVYGNSRWWN